MVEAQRVYQLAYFTHMDEINKPEEMPVEPVVETPAAEPEAPAAPAEEPAA